jgi:hypothetical protein
LKVTNVRSDFFLHLRGLATSPNIKFLHGLTTARHFRSLFVIRIIRKFTMKIEKFQLHGNNSACAGEFQLLRSYPPARLRGNIEGKLPRS